MTQILNEPRRRFERLLAHEPEYGDTRDVQRVFGIRETMTYQLWRDGQITAVSVRGKGRKRGKRLFDFNSIRKFLAECAAKEEAK